MFVVYYKQQQIDFQNLQLLQIQSDKYNLNHLKKRCLALIIYKSAVLL